MAEIDFDNLFSTMGSSSGADPISGIYNIIPQYDNVQMQLRFQAEYFINKYNLEDARQVFASIDKLTSRNKNLTFMGSKNLQQLLAAYTQTELVRGIKVQTVNTNGSEGGT